MNRNLILGAFAVMAMMVSSPKSTPQGLRARKLINVTDVVTQKNSAIQRTERPHPIQEQVQPEFHALITEEDIEELKALPFPQGRLIHKKNMNQEDTLEEYETDDGGKVSKIISNEFVSSELWDQSGMKITRLYADEAVRTITKESATLITMVKLNSIGLPTQKVTIGINGHKFRECVMYDEAGRPYSATSAKCKVEED